MTEITKVQHRGCQKPDLIVVYNWDGLGWVDNLSIKSSWEIACEHKVVAVFKIKWKYGTYRK